MSLKTLAKKASCHSSSGEMRSTARQTIAVVQLLVEKRGKAACGAAGDGSGAQEGSGVVEDECGGGGG